MPPSSNSTATGTGNGKKMSFNAMVKAAGFSSFNQFLLSYNLRVYNPEDVEEGKRILAALFEQRSQ